MRLGYILFIALIMILNSCNDSEYLTTDKPITKQYNFKFNQAHEFKILQFTDTHIQTAFANEIFKGLNLITDYEKPDLVVITGDVSHQYEDTIMMSLATIFSSRKIYWVVVFGNHDEDSLHNRKDLTNVYSNLPYNLNSSAPGIKGESNFIISITGDGDKYEALLYFFDSNSYNEIKNRAGATYAWIDFSQINWYRKQSDLYTRNNNGKPLPSIAFFHIPLPEFKLLRENDFIGTKLEEVACAHLNSGVYTNMIECGDIMGIFAGHDHFNDFIGKYYDMALAYGRFSGTNNTYGNLTTGARVIVLKEGKREFDTWIREKDGSIELKCSYPLSFIDKSGK